MSQQLYVLTSFARYGETSGTIRECAATGSCYSRFSHKIKLSPYISPSSEANFHVALRTFVTVITRADHWPLSSDQFRPTYMIVLIFILILSLNSRIRFTREIFHSGSPNTIFPPVFLRISLLHDVIVVTLRESVNSVYWVYGFM
jgi:hypothetical protein